MECHGHFDASSTLHHPSRRQPPQAAEAWRGVAGDSVRMRSGMLRGAPRCPARHCAAPCVIWAPWGRRGRATRSWSAS
eukprot:15453928-Alexandrium_andersonii.AAC.1